MQAEWVRYTDINPMLGDAFVDAVEQAIFIARQFPEMGSPYRYGTRRVFPKRFPHSVVYVHRDVEIVVLAVAPYKRKPAYWKARRHET